MKKNKPEDFLPADFLKHAVRCEQNRLAVESYPKDKRKVFEKTINLCRQSAPFNRPGSEIDLASIDYIQNTKNSGLVEGKSRLITCKNPSGGNGGRAFLNAIQLSGSASDVKKALESANNFLAYKQGLRFVINEIPSAGQLRRCSLPINDWGLLTEDVGTPNMVYDFRVSTKAFLVESKDNDMPPEFIPFVCGNKSGKKLSKDEICLELANSLEPGLQEKIKKAWDETPFKREAVENFLKQSEFMQKQYDDFIKSNQEDFDDFESLEMVISYSIPEEKAGMVDRYIKNRDHFASSISPPAVAGSNCKTTMFKKEGHVREEQVSFEDFSGFYKKTVCEFGDGKKNWTFLCNIPLSEASQTNDTSCVMYYADTSEDSAFKDPVAQINTIKFNKAQMRVVNANSDNEYDESPPPVTSESIMQKFKKDFYEVFMSNYLGPKNIDQSHEIRQKYWQSCLE